MNKPQSVDEYLAAYPPEVREKLEAIRETIRQTAPEAVESISYGMPAYKLDGKPLCYFAAFKHHLGFYPLPQAIEEFAADLAAYPHAKGSIQFPLDQPMPLALVKRMVQFRMKESRG